MLIFIYFSGNMVTSEDMLAWLRPFCGDDSKPVRPRIEVLQILEHSFSLSDQDIHLLVFFRSQAVVKACWPNRKVKNMHIPTLAQNTIYTSHINIITFPHLWLSISLFPLWGTVNVISFYSAALCELACAYRNCLTILTHVVLCVFVKEWDVFGPGITDCLLNHALWPHLMLLWGCEHVILPFYVVFSVCPYVPEKLQ